MIEPTVTFQGVVTLSDAKRLVAAAEAAAQTVYVTLKARIGDPDYADPTVYRVQPDGTSHYVGPDGEWAPLGYPWPLGRVNSEGVRVTTEAHALRQQQARRPTWTPQVGEWMAMRTTLTEALDALAQQREELARVKALIVTWREQTNEYPQTIDTGRYAAKAVRLCADELESATGASR